MESTQFHEFHFVMKKRMKENLQGLELYKKTGSISGIVVRILSLLTPVFKKEYKWGEQRKSRYLPVSDDPGEIREHVHVYFPEDIYRQLKLLHADLNLFSLAQLLRVFLGFFLDMVNVYGNNVIVELKKLFEQWNVEDNKIKQTPWKIIRQLYEILLHIQDQNRFITIYNNKFSPFWVFHL